MMTNEIFYQDSNYTFEECVHNMFNDVNKLKKKGSNNFLVEYVNKYDMFLSIYLQTHIYLLKDVVNSLNKIILKWNNYNDRIDSERFLIIQEKALAVFNDCDIADFNKDEIICDIFKKLNIHSKYIFEVEKDDDFNMFFDEFTDKNDFSDRKFFESSMTKFISGIYKINNLRDLEIFYENYEEKKDIISFPKIKKIK